MEDRKINFQISKKLNRIILVGAIALLILSFIIFEIVSHVNISIKDHYYGNNYEVGSIRDLLNIREITAMFDPGIEVWSYFDLRSLIQILDRVFAKDDLSSNLFALYWTGYYCLITTITMLVFLPIYGAAWMLIL